MKKLLMVLLAAMPIALSAVQRPKINVIYNNYALANESGAFNGYDSAYPGSDITCKTTQDCQKYHAGDACVSWASYDEYVGKVCPDCPQRPVEIGAPEGTCMNMLFPGAVIL